MRKKTLKTLIYNVFPINVILILPPLPVLLGLVLVTLLRNNLIKFIKRIAFGYRKYDHFISRIFLIKGIIKG